MTDESRDNAQGEDRGGEKGEVGRLLRSARESRQLDLQALADQLHLRPSIVQAIEEGDYGAVPSELFLKGYIRSYARHLGLSDDDLIRQLNRELEPEHEAEEKARQEDPVEKIRVRKQQRRKWVLGLIVVAMLVGAMLIWPMIDQAADEAGREQVPAEPEVQQQEEPVPAEDPDVPEATEVEPAPPEPALGPVDTVSRPATQEQEQVPAPADQADLRITFSGDCWVEVVNGEGQRVVARLATEGQTVEYRGPAPLDILLGAVSAVEQVEYNGEPVDLGQYSVRADRVRFELAAADPN